MHEGRIGIIKSRCGPYSASLGVAGVPRKDGALRSSPSSSLWVNSTLSGNCGHSSCLSEVWELIINLEVQRVTPVGTTLGGLAELGSHQMLLDTGLQVTQAAITRFEDLLQRDERGQGTEVSESHQGVGWRWRAVT